MSMLRYYNDMPENDRLELFQNLLRKINCASINKKKRLLNVAASFDTEVCSFTDETDGLETALVYVWMFGIDTCVIYGRDIDEFQEFLYVLNRLLCQSNYKLIVYVHNFKYDFAFIRKLFQWDKVFMTKPRVPLFAVTQSIEFRDSLILSGGKSLAFIGDHLNTSEFRKAVGALDYQLLRCPITPLTDKELYYCEMDIRVLNAYISEKIEEEHGDISKIPYTNTGYVRRYVKNACFGERPWKYRDIMDGLTIAPAAYQQCEKAYMGGASGPNIRKIGLTIKQVASYDIKSSYPYAMISGYYPMSYPIPVKNSEARQYLNNPNYCCIFRLTLLDVTPKTDYCFPIMESKCINLHGARIASNRVITALWLDTMCTELDYDTYCKFYNITEENSRISEMRVYKRGRLPAPIVKSIFEFFNRKTTLDGVEGQEALYMVSKNMLNSIYGMIVEKPIRPVYKYEHGKFVKDEADYVARIEEYNNNANRFLYYPWGVYVTAHARWRLYDAIYEVGTDFVYCDTDSVKFECSERDHKAYFDRVNEQARLTVKQAAQYYGVDLEYAVPRSPKGSKKWLGVWEKEFTATKFKTIGAKRYLYETADGELHLTVAGTNKEHTLYYLINCQFFKGINAFDMFDEHLIIPSEYSKRLVTKAIDEERSGIMHDYLGNRYYYNTPSGWYMSPSAYTFSITDDIKRELAILVDSAFVEPGEIE